MVDRNPGAPDIYNYNSNAYDSYDQYSSNQPTKIPTDPRYTQLQSFPVNDPNVYAGQNLTRNQRTVEVTTYPVYMVPN
jgi:hypothetical protein